VPLPTKLAKNQRPHRADDRQQQRTFSCSHLSSICLTMVRCAVTCWAVRGRASVKTKTGSRFFVTEVIVSALGAENSIFVTRFVGSVKSCLCQLLLLVGAIARAKATAGTVPCSKMWSIQRLIIGHFALSVTPPFEFEDCFCFRCTSKTFRSLLLSACRSSELSECIL
jgi:hypothetical protein